MFNRAATFFSIVPERSAGNIGSSRLSGGSICPRPPGRAVPTFRLAPADGTASRSLSFQIEGPAQGRPKDESYKHDVPSQPGLGRHHRPGTVGRALTRGHALAFALVVIVLVQPTLGPQVSRADLASPSLPVEELHRQVDASKLPVQPIPEP